MKALSQLGKIIAIAPLCVAAVLVYAQGTREDYARAERFLPGNVRHLVSEADVAPHWIEKSERFWYRKDSPSGKQFLLVDAARNTGVPAFDHGKLAVALAQATGKQYQPNKLPSSSAYRPFSRWQRLGLLLPDYVDEYKIGTT